MTSTMLLSVICKAVVIAGVHHGAGRHAGDLSMQDFEMGMKRNFIGQPTFVAAV